MSFLGSLHEARKARLARMAAGARAPERAPRRELDRDYERAWAVEILGLAERRPGRLKIREIQREVARHFGVPWGDIRSSNGRNAARPRQVAMYLARVLTAKSLPEIGRYFARDHSTVLHAVRRIESLLERDAEVAASIDRIRGMLDA